MTRIPLLIFFFLFSMPCVRAQHYNTLNLLTSDGDTVSIVFDDQLSIKATTPAELTIYSGIYSYTCSVGNVRKFTLSHTEVITIDDITTLITRYLSEPDTTLTLADITSLIDRYLRQTPVVGSAALRSAPYGNALW
jgi:hypothetical protein